MHSKISQRTVKTSCCYSKQAQLLTSALLLIAWMCLMLDAFKVVQYQL